jgi:hypothetical protein
MVRLSLRTVYPRGSLQTTNPSWWVTLVSGVIVALVLAASATAAAPSRWTPSQAASAMMRQAEDFYVETTELGYKMPRDLTAARCRGTGKHVQRRFVSFVCKATLQRGVADPLLNVRVNAKTRRAGGICWAADPSPIPSGCFAPGRRGEGSVTEAFRAMVRKVGTSNQDFRCLPHGAGFFTCSWTTGEGQHRGTVTFGQRAVVRIIA